MYFYMDVIQFSAITDHFASTNDKNKPKSLMKNSEISRKKSIIILQL